MKLTQVSSAVHQSHAQVVLCDQAHLAWPILYQREGVRYTANQAARTAGNVDRLFNADKKKIEHFGRHFDSLRTTDHKLRQSHFPICRRRSRQIDGRQQRRAIGCRITECTLPVCTPLLKYLMRVPALGLSYPWHTHPRLQSQF
jgi:hypothetical protein